VAINLARKVIPEMDFKLTVDVNLVVVAAVVDMENLAA
jgi:hypothetical protein